MIIIHVMGTLTILFIIIAAVVVFAGVITGKLSSIMHSSGPPGPPGQTLAQSFGL